MTVTEAAAARRASQVMHGRRRHCCQVRDDRSTRTEEGPQVGAPKPVVQADAVRPDHHRDDAQHVDGQHAVEGVGVHAAEEVKRGAALATGIRGISEW